MCFSNGQINSIPLKSRTEPNFCPRSHQTPWSFCTEHEMSGTIVEWANWEKAHGVKEDSRQFRLLNLWLDKWAGHPAQCSLRLDTLGSRTVLSLARQQWQKCWFFSQEIISPQQGQHVHWVYDHSNKILKMCWVWLAIIMSFCHQKTQWDKHNYTWLVFVYKSRLC